jgi:hypothetical protein
MRHRCAALAFLLGLSLALGAAGPVPATAAAQGYRMDLYRPGDFVSQTNTVQCIGASMQMMLMMIGRTDDRTAARQLELQQLARAYSPRWTTDVPIGTDIPPTQDRERRGASSRGWVAGLQLAGAGSYRLTSAATLEEAVSLAAQAIRATGRPAGLLVWRGAHAWVMSGFEATADPGLDSRAAVTAVIVQDPWYPRISRTWGRSPEPGSRLTLSQLGEDFVAWERGNRTSPNSGRFVLVLPYQRSVGVGLVLLAH